MLKFFKIEENSIKVDEEVSKLPEIKPILLIKGKEVKNHLKYIALFCEPGSPYMNLSEQDRHRVLRKDIYGKDEPEKLPMDLIISAIDKVLVLTMTIEQRLADALNYKIDEIIVFLKTTKTNSDNLKAHIASVKDAMKLLQEKKLLDKTIKEGLPDEEANIMGKKKTFKFEN